MLLNIAVLLYIINIELILYFNVYIFFIGGIYMKKQLFCTLIIFATLSLTSTVFASQEYKKQRYALKDTWMIHNDAWCYVDSEGTVSTGWKNILDHWFYFDNEGKMVTNQWVGDYYIGPNGMMLTDTTTPDGYKVGNDGTRISEKIVLNEPKAASTLEKHAYYKYCTKEQAEQADAVARSIATRVLSDTSLITDIAKIKKASSIIYKEYIINSSRENDENKYYRSPYGVFIAGISTSAGGTRALGRVLDFMGYDWEHANPNTKTHQWCIVNMDNQAGYADAMGYGCGFGIHPYISEDINSVNKDITNDVY